MTFDQSGQSSPGQSSSAQTSVRTADGGLKPGQSSDIRELVGQLTSRKKIAANRNNAKESTGPRTARGKSRSRSNALKYGVFAAQRLLPGEDAKAYQRLSDRVFTEVRPRTAVETMLADQIVGNIWRLDRIERAERAYFEQVRAAALARALRSLSAEELKRAPEIVGVTDQPLPEGAQSLTLRQKLEGATNLDGLMLDGMVSPDASFAYSSIEQIRRSLVCDTLRKVASLEELREHALLSAETLLTPNNQVLQRCER